MKLTDIPDTDELPNKKACIDCGKSLRGNAKLRCRGCWTIAKIGRPYIYNPGTVPHEPDICHWHAQDERFRQAMIRAVEANLETPACRCGSCSIPTQRACKTYGTQRPMDEAQLRRHLGLPPRNIPMRSADMW